MLQKTFIHLLQATFQEEEPSVVQLSEEQWSELYARALREEVAGWLWPTIERLPEAVRPPRSVRLAWALSAERMRNTAQKQNQVVAAVWQRLHEDGLRPLLLKGQAVSSYYPDPDSRLSGDIDLWVNGSRKEVVRYARATKADCKPVYHHVDAAVAGEEHIELHIVPTWMYGWRVNRRLQRWFDEQRAIQFAPARTLQLADQRVAVPTPDFMRRYLLVHLYRHLFEEGITVRRLVDYGMVMRQRMSEDERVAFVVWVKRMHLQRFTAEVMFVMSKLLAIPEEQLPIVGDRRGGEKLLAELSSLRNPKNNGKFDESNPLLHRAAKAVRTQYRNLRYVCRYPAEVLSAPLFKAGHYLWRRWHGWT